MGNELAKRYAIEPDATGSGGHGYSWKSYSATRKKDGLEVSVFVFDKSALEKKLRGQGKDLVRQIVEVMRRDVEVMAEYSGVDPKALGCVLWEAYGKRGMGSRGQRSAPLLDGCGDSLYRHRSMVATKLAQNLDVALLPPLARDAVGRALAPGPAGRPDGGAPRLPRVAKSSLAGPGGACGKLSGELVPAVCRVAVAATSPLGCKVRAHKALAACLERPAATPPDVVSGVCVPALHASVKKVDGHPALAMCVLGATTSSRSGSERSHHARAPLVPLLDEDAEREAVRDGRRPRRADARGRGQGAAHGAERRRRRARAEAAPAVPARALRAQPDWDAPAPAWNPPAPAAAWNSPAPAPAPRPHSAADPSRSTRRRRAPRRRARRRSAAARPEPAAAAGRDVDAAGAAAQLDANAAEIARLKQQLASVGRRRRPDRDGAERDPEPPVPALAARGPLRRRGHGRRGHGRRFPAAAAGLLRHERAGRAGAGPFGMGGALGGGGMGGGMQMGGGGMSAMGGGGMQMGGGMQPGGGMGGMSSGMGGGMNGGMGGGMGGMQQMGAPDPFAAQQQPAMGGDPFAGQGLMQQPPPSNSGSAFDFMR
ncbi:hypothetical protein JL722_3745 [Aureococcus anophagefferens]|nr:hypothetical protein JL722_3745 [Aureococcus anophagefferens]